MYPRRHEKYRSQRQRRSKITPGKEIDARSDNQVSSNELSAVRRDALYKRLCSAKS